jgi:hypothetical protein
MTRISLPNPYPWPTRYGVGLAAAIVTTSASAVLLHRGLHLESGIMLIGVIFAAWFGGTDAGFLCLGLNMVAQIFLRKPYGSWAVQGSQQQLGLILFLIDAVLICLLFRGRLTVRAWRKVSPGMVTGGWWWKYDATGEGTVELSSPAFPHLAVTRTYWSWLQQVSQEDRDRIESEVRKSMVTGRIDTEFHVKTDAGEVRQIFMSGLRIDRRIQGLTAVCIELGANNADPQAFLY